jgi:uncharacterized protein involved in exopolysaccharide biosynthesis
MAEPFTTRTLRELTRVVFSHLVGMILIVALLTGGTYVACKKANPIYESSVTILVKQPKRQTTAVQEVSPDRSLEVFLKTQRELVLSDRVLSRALILMEDKSLRDQWDKARKPLDTAPLDQRDEILARIVAVTRTIDKKADALINTRQEDLRRARKNVDVRTPGGEMVGMSEVFTIRVRATDTPDYKAGQRARTSADLLASCYMDRYWELQNDSVRDTTAFARQRMTQLRSTTLEPAMKALNDFLTSKLGSQTATPSTQAVSTLNPADVVILEQLLKSGTEAGTQIVRRRFEEERIRLGTDLASALSLQQQIAEQIRDEKLVRLLARSRIDQLEAQVMTLAKSTADNKENARRQDELAKITAELSTMTDEPRIVVPEEVLKNNDIVNKMKKKLADLIIERNKMSGQFAPTYRQLVDLYIEIARAKLEIIEEMKAEKKALDVKIETLRSEQDEVARQLAVLTTKLDAVSVLLPDYERLKNDLTMARTNYAKMETDLLSAQADEQQARKAITVQVVDEASVPDPERPAIPWTPVYTLIALAVSLLLAMAYAFLADHFDHTLRSIQEAERYLGVPVIGSVSKAGRRIVL